MCTKFQAPSNQGTSGTPVFGPGGVCSPPQHVAELVLKQLVEEQPALIHNFSFRAHFLIASLDCSVRPLFKIYFFKKTILKLPLSNLKKSNYQENASLA